MKKYIQSIVFLALFGFSFIIHAQEDQRVSHVVVVWLNEPGNAQMREKFINTSRGLEDLPGVVSRHVSAVIPSERSINDDTFDVAVTVTFENAQALKKYMKSQQHKDMLNKQLKPLVNRVVVYNFGNL
ncbi:MAG: Dabb family protein [Gammaproteobacteria bacterium]|nr:Dabb family protein [Gammaproteobacteria bacterium]MBT5825491.1 Dabb family protein [Gammaproteobacteria bacterium]MBT6419392.1 Dabb family protein [Gammaproteobacteria bacterium]MBT6576051.1 Dabb family protein [Gammaproteobacteria bacterium]